MTYEDLILLNNPFAYFRLGEADGEPVTDLQSGIILQKEILAGGAILYEETGLVFDDNDTCFHFEDAGLNGIIALDYTAPSSIEGWFQSDVSTSNEQIIFSNFFDLSDWSYQLVAVDFGGRLELRINTTTGISIINAAGIIFTDGEKYYFAITYDGNNVFFYVNGFLVGSAMNINIVPIVSNAFTIANYYTATQLNAFNGWVDEVVLYDYTLSASIVADDYEGGIHSPDPMVGYYDAVIASNPVSYWRFGELAGATIAVDEIGNADANYAGPVVLQATGALVDDADTAVGLPDKTRWATAQNPVLNFTNDYTLAAWVNFDVINNAGNTDTQQTIIVKRTNGTNAQTEYLVDLYGGNLRFVGSNSSVISSTVLVASLWYFIVVTKQNSVGIIYINSILDAQGTIVLPGTINTNPIGIGAPVDFGIQIASVRGVVDEVSLYNRALTQPEIEQIYNSGIVPPTASDGGVFAGTINLL